MAGGKLYLNINVLEAAQARIRLVFDHFETVVVSFSGGKDSTVLLELARREAGRRGRSIYVLFVDPEAQYRETIQHIERSILHDPVLIPIWVCVPLLWRNGLSVFQPHWRSWDPDEKAHWVRPMPTHDCVISDTDALPFYDPNFGIDEVVIELPKMLKGPDQTYASLVGIRADESFHRYTAIKGRKRRIFYRTPDGRRVRWASLPDKRDNTIVNFYPVYDWHVEDVWTYIGRERLPYNRIYDLLYLSGVPLHQQRICQPYGDEQRRGLDQWARIEPETWAAALDRVAGVNMGAKYARQKMLGYSGGVGLPAGHTWKSYTFFLLSTLPITVREKHLANFAIALEWYMKERYYDNLEEIPDDDTPIPNPSGFNIPSWRKMCLAILKNDFWGTTLDIGVTKYPLRDVYEAVETGGAVNVRVSVEPFYEYLRGQYGQYEQAGIDAVEFDFTHPTVDRNLPLREKWRDL